MAYAAVRGGKTAIDEAARLVEYFRLKGGSSPIEVRQIREQMRAAVDRVMGEGSLYAPDLAALALKQAEGDTLEASFLLRAYRSTLPRNLYTLPIDTSEMQVIRRISAAFKDVPGGQYLGPTRDYTKRLLNFELMDEDEAHVRQFMESYLHERTLPEYASPGAGEAWEEGHSFPRMVDLLRREGLLEDRGGERREQVEKLVHDAVENAVHGDRRQQAESAVNSASQGPSHNAVEDITRASLKFPASRAAKLQSLARGETGAMMALAYSSNRGYGHVHPTLGELRVGYVPVRIPHPLKEGAAITIGSVLVTEAEIIARMEGRIDEPKPKFSLGYGLCFGHNEIKAIAMGTLDRAMVPENPQAPAEDEEFVLYHIDGIEASGFVSHWKLPHYVDFQAELLRVRSIQERDGGANG